jgi:predicted DNA-binding transcriptional regulator AlpA
MNDKTMLRYLSEREVSGMTGLSPKTLQRWRLFGTGPVFRKLGGAVRYSEADVVAWIAASPVGGGLSREAH